MQYLPDPSMLFKMEIFHAFLWLHNILIYVCIILYIYIHVIYIIYIYIYIYTHTHTICFCILVITSNATMKLGCRYQLKLVFSFPLAIYPGVELLDHKVISFLIFWDPLYYFLQWLHQVTSPLCCRIILVSTPVGSCSSLCTLFNCSLNSQQAKCGWRSWEKTQGVTGAAHTFILSLLA